MPNQSPAPVAGAVEALRLAEELKALRRRRSGIVCGLLTAACCDKLDAEQDALIDRLAALHPQPAPVVAVEAITDGMVTAYLDANAAYWHKADQTPAPPARWKSGSAREATRFSLQAAIAAQPARSPK